MTGDDLQDERRHEGSRSERRESPTWVWWTLGVMVVTLVVSLALVVRSGQIADDAKEASMKAQHASEKASRALTEANSAKAAANRQREGRGIALDVICGFGNGVERAGQRSITAPLLPVAFRENLEQLGLPPDSVRIAGQKMAARAYARSISGSVARQVGPHAAKAIINKDGTMNCAALRRLAKASKPGASSP